MDDFLKMKTTNIGTFIGQSRTQIVLGRQRYRVHNTHLLTRDVPDHLRYPDPFDEDRKSTELEKLYKKFCEDALKIITGDSSLQGGYMPVRIIFPDFNYDIIPNRLDVV